MDTIDVIKEFFSNNPDVKLLTFTKYPMQTLIQDDSKISDDDEKLISSALKIRKDFYLPFWDSLMLSTFDKENVSINLLSRALRHNHNKEKINTNNIEQIEELLKNNKNFNLSINSEVVLDGDKTKHFLLLDFHIYPSDNNLKIISDILSILNVHGYILNSGKSYHFISNSLFDLDSLIDLLAKALLFAPIIDRAWIAHQIIERSCSIRVSKKNDQTPEVIKSV